MPATVVTATQSWSRCKTSNLFLETELQWLQHYLLFVSDRQRNLDREMSVNFPSSATLTTAFLDNSVSFSCIKEVTLENFFPENSLSSTFFIIIIPPRGGRGGMFLEVISRSDVHGGLHGPAIRGAAVKLQCVVV
ncbi:hypothetical protein AVEN_171528-1 [Araneus ventricosus]|uniref:Uncharacterized protein n=1 Tax=Araneus ventricosus TaxID=182803 RepID=A0A4Y2MAU2_ARAVE|nr:hypothetical protein AVEN_171528-1 [Araneus ventricosus]